MNMYVKGPFNRTDWQRLQASLQPEDLNLDILNRNLPENLPL
jgi:hypothetical protein